MRTFLGSSTYPRTGFPLVISSFKRSHELALIYSHKERDCGCHASRLLAKVTSTSPLFVAVHHRHHHPIAITKKSFAAQDKLAILDTRTTSKDGNMVEWMYNSAMGKCLYKSWSSPTTSAFSSRQNTVVPSSTTLFGRIRTRRTCCEAMQRNVVIILQTKFLQFYWYNQIVFPIYKPRRQHGGQGARSHRT